ncbi:MULTISPECIES: VanW family protein [Amycolatopsis]|uniref:VanW family protein n=1 Tax=Amycolatopsis echigonensis TaxID=2576905 RepID=A0A2N3WLB6_9PSEU|nr:MULTISPECIES: VanW family protein [Amycolatopsis]MBB2500834.1 VanW family protein [Amycolatopsis echigonensis]MCG3751209.1 VanW family protein [Amycolatopsis sp. Poz14]PKV94673.1 vancomycin resistance protein YoaR [Amycolatopsis niigatensis]
MDDSSLGSLHRRTRQNHGYPGVFLHPATDNASWPSTDPDDQDPGGGSGAARPWWRRPLTIALAAAAGALAVAYVIGAIATIGEVPGGTTVAGVAVGGLSPAEAQAKLTAALTPRLAQPVQVSAGDRTARFVPASAKIQVDYAATVAQAGTQSPTPWGLLGSLFGGREFRVMSSGDDQALNAVIAGLRPAVDRPMTEGDVRFDGVAPVPVQPEAGQELDETAARQALVTEWANAADVKLPIRTLQPKVPADEVRRAVDEIAKPAVSAPATVRGDGRDAAVTPARIAAALRFRAGDNGNLVPSLDKDKLGAVADKLAATEKQGQDARMDFSSGSPVVTPSTDGRQIDWDQTLAGLLKAITGPGDRAVQAKYTDVPAKVTSGAVKSLGIKEVIGEFTTTGFAQDSGVNIRVVAQKVNGAIVKPGETFSLNGYTGPRGTPQGYVEAGVIEEGVPAREVGGGISQFATTTYNAAYFAGMTDAGHKEHSFYISRYPAAREATVFQNPDGSSVIDLKFANDSATGVAIQTIWTNSSITVKLWGTKHVNVESVPGPKHDFVNPPTVTKSDASCKPVQGKPGFTASDTRVIRDLGGKELSRHTRNVRYNPEPTVVCAGSG